MTAWFGIPLAGVAFMLAPARAEPRCAPSARLAGDPSIVSAIDPILRARGVEVVGAVSQSPAYTAPACSSVSVHVERGGTRVMVWITDPDGRRTERVADDPEAAATVIESWARDDLMDPLLATRRQPVLGSGSDGLARSQVAGSSTAPVRSRFMLIVAGDGGVSGDGAVWTGARAQACAAFGPICLGGVLRYGIDLERTGDTKRLAGSRRAYDVTFTAELPVRRHRFLIAPGLGVGQTSVTASNTAELEQASAIHLRAGLAAAVGLGGAWSLRADLSLDVAPTARVRLGEPDGIDRQLAASPKLHTWLGIGLAYGAP